VYVGPLNVLASSDAGQFTVARPSGGLTIAMKEGIGGTVGGLTAAGASLAIWSRADNFFYQVGGGWIDNEFDTQRRRGRPRTDRTFI
jgi:hypothetical protein